MSFTSEQFNDLVFDDPPAPNLNTPTDASLNTAPAPAKPENPWKGMDFSKNGNKKFSSMDEIIRNKESEERESFENC
jgi:hypothetical protein